MEWDEIVKLEPRLKTLENYVRGWRRGCRNNGRMNLPTKTWRKRQDVKNQLEPLVGVCAKKPKLKTWAAHDTAMRHLDKVLYHNLREEIYFENGNYVIKDMRDHITRRRCGETVNECICKDY